MVEAFLTYMRCELNSSVHTVLAYRKDLCQFATFLTGGKPEAFEPLSVTPSDVRMWAMQLAEEGNSHRTIRRKVTAVSSFYRYLQKRGDVAANPAADIPLPKLEKHLPVFIRQDEMQDMLNSNPVTEAPAGIDFDELRNRLVVLMLYSTGMRESELIGLMDANVDTRRRELKVLGKRNKERVIPFGEELAEAIERYRPLRPKAAAPNFFVRAGGEPLYPRLVYRIVHAALLGNTHATRLSPHTLRHSFASDMLNNGANLSGVQQLLGHASLATTQVYTHITYRELQQNYQLAHPRAQKL